MSKPAIRFAAFVGALPVDVALKARTALLLVMLVGHILASRGGVLLIYIPVSVPIILDTTGIVFKHFVDITEAVRVPSPVLVARLGPFRDFSHSDRLLHLIFARLSLGAWPHDIDIIFFCGRRFIIFIHVLSFMTFFLLSVDVQRPFVTMILISIRSVRKRSCPT